MNSIPQFLLSAVATARLSLMLVAYLVCAGCDNTTANSRSSSPAADNLPSATASSKYSRASQDKADLAEYEFHRNVAFTDVTKNLPDGSVDHIHFDTDADPSVVIVVTIPAPQTDNARFATTFTGPNQLKIEIEWSPASGGNDDGKTVGLFVLPADIDSACTVAR